MSPWEAAAVVSVVVVCGTVLVLVLLTADGPGGGQAADPYLPLVTPDGRRGGAREDLEVPNPLDPGGVAHRLRVGLPISPQEAHWAADVIQEYGRLLRVREVPGGGSNVLGRRTNGKDKTKKQQTTDDYHDKWYAGVDPRDESWRGGWRDERLSREDRDHARRWAKAQRPRGGLLRRLLG